MELYKITPICLALAVVGGCGSGGNSDSDSETMATEPAVAAANPVPSSSPDPSPYAETTAATDLLSATETQSETSAIVVDPNFNFDTTKTSQVTLDIAAARGMTTNVSICSDYEPAGSSYKVDFKSCFMSVSMEDGYFEHPMKTLGHHEALIAVVWFPTQGTPPEFHEIALN